MPDKFWKEKSDEVNAMTREERGKHFDKTVGKPAGDVARNVPTAREVGQSIKQTASDVANKAVEVGKAMGEAAMALPRAPEIVKKVLHEKGYGIGAPEAEAKKRK